MDADKVSRYISAVNGRRVVVADCTDERVCEYLDAVCQDESSRTDSRVKVLVTSDIHETPFESIVSRGADLVIFAGDIMNEPSGESDAEGFAYLEDHIFPWCERHGDIPVVIVPGNHDKFLFRMFEKGEKLGWPKNVRYLVDSGCKAAGLRIYGTPWCTKDRPGRFEAEDETLSEKFSKIPDSLDILISHTPPYVNGERIDFVEDIGWHEGSKELSEAILKKKPRYCFCGHIHEGSRKTVSLGDTQVNNIARVKDDRGKPSVAPKMFVIDRV